VLALGSESIIMPTVAISTDGILHKRTFVQQKAGSAVYAGLRVTKNCCFIEIMGDRFAQCIVLSLRWHSLSRVKPNITNALRTMRSFFPDRIVGFGFSEAFAQSA
jgi:hypothetical protein